VSRFHWRRTAVVVIGLLLIIGSLGGLKYWQISTLMAAGESMQAAGPPPEAVGSAVAQTQSWPSELTAVGTITGIESVAVSNEQPGVVTKVGFESGDLVRRGQSLVELDAQVERAQLSAAKARRALARLTAERTRTLVAKSAVPRDELDRDETALAAANNEVKGIQAQIDHKVVRAPFAGRAGIRGVSRGQYLGPGTTVTTVESVAGLWADFSLPQEQLARVAVGMPVRVQLADQQALEGTITAIDSSVDPATRSVKVRAALRDQHASLRSGMFVTVTLELPARADVVVVPATAIVHAPYGDSIFVIQDKPPLSPGMSTTPDGRPVKIARQQFVKVGQARGDFVAIDKGLKPGQPIVSFGAFKLRNGAPIVIDNRVQPKLELEPHPEDR
jgi:membrane fusion protein (multidrug efflux system)